jgi:NADH dehydrogenase [ubiquinone] 1 alpha subcomplex assembly factor 5
MAEPLFDMRVRAMRRDRAARRGPALFLSERVFDDCLERIGDVGRRFRSALVVGCPDPGWPARLRAVVEEVDVFDPGPLFAAAARGQTITEDTAVFAPGGYDLCLAIGTLDTVNDLSAALRNIRQSLQSGSFLIGAVAGGDTLPQLRLAMRAADALSGSATPHVHPRIEASALAPLLAAAGFTNPVVDVDRVRVSYSSVNAVVDDLRAMGATNVLNARSRAGLNRSAMAAATEAFARVGDGQRTEELFEILHFAGWTPKQG